MSGYDDLEAQAAALDESCPVCAQPSGESCRNVITGDVLRACHWQRITAAMSRISPSGGRDVDRNSDVTS